MFIKNLKSICNYSIKASENPPWRILFFGTDEFSVFSLQELANKRGSLVSKLEVVTTIKGNNSNPVKQFSESHGLHLHKWPLVVDKELFDVGLVVSFGHLIPENIIDKFEHGILNVHASLLPRWRGASPIIHALANGDQETGITIMEISPKKFDVGRIVSQASLPISSDMKLPELHRKLGILGAHYLIQTLEQLPKAIENARPQPNDGISYAPKIGPNFAHIKWTDMTSLEIYNLDRALAGVFHLLTSWHKIPIKLVNVSLASDLYNNNNSDYSNCKPGFVEYDRSQHILRVFCCDLKCITVENIRVTGKKVMSAKDFNNGYLRKQPLSCRYFE